MEFGSRGDSFEKDIHLLDLLDDGILAPDRMREERDLGGEGGWTLEKLHHLASKC